eukprot:CAMPEP_0197923610 /NCGR_PEP_ID=MMETSP1439-20131203/94268_1 /TAXON_ID=66791 /ORGANISM="Gonyaulax spinifera, Strain CCMP409" /LENGTH=265 /DNA_ID=CAMNT_0043545997 /DNA_START=84 /DNA_END=879 /DNA_ORIENTATION=-
MRTTLLQGGKHLSLDHSNCGGTYLSELSSAMSDGMAMSISYWGNKAKTMDWLDDEVCPDIDCKKHNAGIGVISAIRVEGPEPPGMTSLSPSSPTVQPWFPSSTLPMWVPVYTLPWNPSPNSGPAATAPPLPGLPGGAASSTSQTTRSSLASKFLNPRVALAAAVAAIAVAGVALTAAPPFSSAQGTPACRGCTAMPASGAPPRTSSAASTLSGARRAASPRATPWAAWARTRGSPSHRTPECQPGSHAPDARAVAILDARERCVL